MPFAFSYPIIFCAYRLSTSMPWDNRCALPGIKFRKTYAHTSFELTLTCLVLARLIFSRKKRCILWPFKLTSDLFLLVSSISSIRKENPVSLLWFCTLVGGSCGSSADNSANVQCVVVGSFAKSTQGHLRNVRYLKILPWTVNQRISHEPHT